MIDTKEPMGAKKMLKIWGDEWQFPNAMLSMHKKSGVIWRVAFRIHRWGISFGMVNWRPFGNIKEMLIG